jgi:hypothetical protein
MVSLVLIKNKWFYWLESISQKYASNILIKKKEKEICFKYWAEYLTKNQKTRQNCTTETNIDRDGDF